jgi:putative ABC transport system permease protein
MLRMLHQISLPQLRASWGRASLVVSGIATGVSLIVAINVINTSVLENFRQTIEHVSGPADLEVTLGMGEVGFAEAAVDTVRADPDVVAAIPLIRGTVALAEDPHAILQLFGADMIAENDLERYRITAITDRKELLPLMVDPQSILLTAVFASKRGIAVGDRITLSTPAGVKDFAVRGLLDAGGLAVAFGGQLAVMDLPAAQLLLRKERQVDQIDVVLRPEADSDAARRRLTAALPRVLTVARPAQRVVRYERVVGSFQAMLTGISTLCLVAGIFIVYSTTATGTTHRAAAMARLRLIGATGSRLLGLLMVEALVLGIAGTLLGIVAGIGLAWALSGMVTDSMGVIFQIRFPFERLAVDGLELAAIAVVGIGASLFASHFAARRVVALEPLDVLRGSVQLSGGNIGSQKLVVWWLLLIGVSAGALVLQERFQSIAWGNFGATLWNASVIVVAIPVVGWSAEVLSKSLSRLLGAEGRIAAESIVRSTTRAGVTAAAITLVVTLGINLSSLTLSMRSSVNNYLGRVLGADVIVSAVTTEGGWLETPLPGHLAEELAEVPGVRSVDTIRVLPGQLYRGMRIAVGGLSDGFFHPSRYPEGWFREGNAADATGALRTGRGALVSTTLSDRTDLHLGDRIELDTPTGVLVLPVVGVVPEYASDRGTVILRHRLLADRWQDRTVQRLHVTLEPDASIEAVQARIAQRFGDQYLLKVLSLRDLLAYHAGMINRAFAFTNAIQLLVIIVTIAGIFDLLVSSIVERRRELGVWRLIGADEDAVKRSVVIESTTIGALGAILGAGVGLVTAWIWVKFNFRHLIGYYLEAHFAYGWTLWYGVLVMVMTMLAGYAAARQAIRQPLVDSIQVE